RGELCERLPGHETSPPRRIRTLVTCSRQAVLEDGLDVAHEADHRDAPAVEATALPPRRGRARPLLAGAGADHVVCRTARREDHGPRPRSPHTPAGDLAPVV